MPSDRVSQAPVDLEVIDGGGHWLHVEYPDEVASMVREFLWRSSDAEVTT